MSPQGQHTAATIVAVQRASRLHPEHPPELGRRKSEYRGNVYHSSRETPRPADWWPSQNPCKKAIKSPLYKCMNGKSKLLWHPGSWRRQDQCPFAEERYRHRVDLASGRGCIWKSWKGRAGQGCWKSYGSFTSSKRWTSSALSVGFQSCFTVPFLSYVTVLLFGMGVLLCTTVCWKYVTCFWLLQGSQLRDCLSLRRDYALYFFLKLLKSMETAGKGMDVFCIVRWPWTHGGHRVEGYDLKEVSLAVKLTRAGLVIKID